MNSEKIKKLKLPQAPGVYQFKDQTKKIIYVGKAANLKSRLLSYWLKSANHSAVKQAMLKRIVNIDWIKTDSEIEALLLEANLIKKYQPAYNVLLRDDKRFVYLKISLEDEIPGLSITRKIDKAGKYFGPFTSAQAVRATAKAVRKIWPYCQKRRRQNKPCFHYQINLCPGVCAGLISRRQYMTKVIEPIMMFFTGKKERIIKGLTRRQKELIKQGELEQAAGIDYTLKSIKTVLQHADIIGLEEKYQSDVVELAKLLTLPWVPQRIEGYDISNIFGRQSAGSMVVFSRGEPDKSQYRKFKIKIGVGQADDVRMLKEVLTRRFKRLKSSPPTLPYPNPLLLKKGEKKNGGEEAWPLPDLIIIDGGKPQLKAALNILKKHKLDLPVVALSKAQGLRSARAQDKLFFPGEKKPLELPLASPALHLLKRVRDEAHRFALAYHRQLRQKTINQ